MSKRDLLIVVLAAGLGTRMRSRLPKVLHPIAGRPMIRHLLDTLETLSPERLIVVIGPDMDPVAKVVAPHPTVIQQERLGTGHAVMAAQPALADVPGDVLIVYGDTPLLSQHTLEKMIATLRSEPNPAVVVLGFQPEEPGDYGRLMVSDTGMLEGIIEAKDATADQQQIRLCNSGVMAADGKHFFRLLSQVGNANAKGEYYLTDVVELARREGLGARVVDAAEDELLGVNSRVELSAAEALVQSELRARAMAAGVTLTDPETVFFSHDTHIGQDVSIGPFVVFAPGVNIQDSVEIRGFCHFEGVTVQSGAQIGPFARLRPGATIGTNAHIGNFVEIKNATVETGAKVNHLTYIGDARVGSGANVGAGTITCNYDGFFKQHTDIGNGAFIGSNTSLVAPVTIGAGAIIGAGSVIARDVPTDALALTRGPHAEREQWARYFRERRSAEKAAKATSKKA